MGENTYTLSEVRSGIARVVSVGTLQEEDGSSAKHDRDCASVSAIARLGHRDVLAL